MSDLSSWEDSTEEEGQLPETLPNQQFGLGMKHSGGIMDLSKVISEEPRKQKSESAANEMFSLKQKEGMNDDRIYDSVENITSVKKDIESYENRHKHSMDRKQGKTKINGNSPEKRVNYNTEVDIERRNSSNMPLKDELPHPENDSIGDAPPKPIRNHEIRSPQYEKILQSSRNGMEGEDESDWDSPPFSEENDPPLHKTLSPMMDNKTDESSFPFTRKENDLIDSVSNLHSSEQREPQFDKVSSPSLNNVKDKFSGDDVFSVVRANGDNQEFSSLPPNTSKPESNSSLSNNNR